MQNYPLVSILVAARNEENNILRCLTSLAELSYPPEKIEVLVGDDDSEDTTNQVVTNFILTNQRFKLIAIAPPAGHLRGKANVLAQLAKAATGTYLFFTDADICVPKTWLTAMLQPFEKQPNVGVVTGITTISGHKILHNLQAIEWLNALAIMRFYAHFGIPLTGMGNNMAVSKTAYWAVGGYEKIPFSITEDYQLFKEIVAKGFGFAQLFNANVLAESQPVESYPKYFEQRKRWMNGVMKLPIIHRTSMYFQAFLMPILIVLCLLDPPLGVLIWGSKMIVQAVVMAGVLVFLGKKRLIWLLTFYEFWSGAMWFAMLINYFLPTKTTWKGRTY